MPGALGNFFFDSPAGRTYVAGDSRGGTHQEKGIRTLKFRQVLATARVSFGVVYAAVSTSACSGAIGGESHAEPSHRTPSPQDNSSIRTFLAYTHEASESPKVEVPSEIPRPGQKTDGSKTYIMPESEA